MRTLLALSFLLIAGSVGHTQSFSFNVGGQPIHVAVRGYCAECISVVVPGYVQYGRSHYSDDVPYVGRSHRPPRNAQAQKRKPQVAMLRDSVPPSASAGRIAAPAPDLKPTIQPPAVAATPPAPPTPAATTSPAVAIVPDAAPTPAVPPGPQPAAQAPTRVLPPAPVMPELAAAPPVPASPIKPEAAPVPSAAPTEQAATPPADKPAADKKPTVIAALPPAKEVERPKPSATSPLGIWSSSEGQMRVEQCGKNFCSYAVGGPHAGKMILRNMRQTSENRWAGQVTDIRSGQTYSAHMSMRGPNSLNIQGCALGGLVCGGRTMTRAR